MEVKARQPPYLVGQVWSHFGRKLSIGMGFGLRKTDQVEAGSMTP